MPEIESPFLRLLQDSLASFRTGAMAHLAGEWRARSRRTYRDSSQLGSGVGPFIDVTDFCWEGSLAGPTAMAAIGFLRTATALHWVKSCPPQPTMEITIAAEAHADCRPDMATVGFGVGGSQLPAVLVSVTPAIPHSLPVVTGERAVCGLLSVMRATPVEFFVLLLPDHMVRVGRNRLWQLRDEHAAALPEQIRSVLTRRRRGDVSDDDASAAGVG